MRFTPKKIVVVGIVVVALSGVGFAVLEAMRPPNPRERDVMVRLAQEHTDGLISDGERARQVDALKLGICGWMVTPDAYRNYRVLVRGGAVLGLLVIGIGAIRHFRSRTVVTPRG